jgi:hypothetical protein
MNIMEVEAGSDNLDGESEIESEALAREQGFRYSMQSSASWCQLKSTLRRTVCPMSGDQAAIAISVASGESK